MLQLPSIIATPGFHAHARFLRKLSDRSTLHRARLLPGPCLPLSLQAVPEYGVKQLSTLPNPCPLDPRRAYFLPGAFRGMNLMHGQNPLLSPGAWQEYLNAAWLPARCPHKQSSLAIPRASLAYPADGRPFSFGSSDAMSLTCLLRSRLSQIIHPTLAQPYAAMLRLPRGSFERTNILLDDFLLFAILSCVCCNPCAAQISPLESRY
jgi:hypothetical protein